VLKFLLTAIGFFLVIKGADIFVNAASVLARRLRISRLVIGLTVVAFGTSRPELAGMSYSETLAAILNAAKECLGLKQTTNEPFNKNQLTHDAAIQLGNKS
jgi:Ca2+/Na+ antiporter